MFRLHVNWPVAIIHGAHKGRTNKWLLILMLGKVLIIGLTAGIYGYPNKAAAEVAIKTTRDILEKNHEKVSSGQKVSLGPFTRLFLWYLA